MTSRTASLRLQLIDAVSGPSKSAAGSLKGLDATISKLGKGASPEVQRLVKQLDHGAGTGGQSTSLEVNAPVDAPINVQLNGVMLPEVLAIVRQTATQAANETLGRLQSTLSQQLNRSSQTTFGGVKPYGD